MPLAVLAITVALVGQDQTALRASAHDGSPRVAALTAGDWLEVRGEHQGYLQVYDHRRQRPGYVRTASVHTYSLDESTAPKLGAVVEYLRDAPGQEALGIAYAALFLRAAPAGTAGAPVFDALGTMADRLGLRASAPKANDAVLAQIDTAESYGVHFVRFDQDGHTHVCYDGEAFRRVLALEANGPARVRAALSLTDPGCTDPSMGWSAALDLAKWWWSTLEGVDPAKLDSEILARDVARLRLRRSVVQSELAYFAARTGDFALAKDASESARRELEGADRSALADEDRFTYEEAALRAASVRWASEAPSPPPASGAFTVELAQGDTITPATVDPELGYVELAGFSPDGAHLALVRESRITGPLGSPNTLAPWMQKNFQIVATGDLQIEKQAATLTKLPAFRQWQTGSWRQGTLALR
jgi:hypothetical protein